VAFYSTGDLLALPSGNDVGKVLLSLAYTPTYNITRTPTRPTCVSTGVPAASPTNTMRQALKTNDLRNWSPTSPVLLCAGDRDPTVFYLNTQLLQQYWTANPPSASVTVLDVDSAVAGGDAYASLKNGFAAAKAAVAASAVAGGTSDGGAMAVRQAYHAGLVPPVCLSAVKCFFDGFQ
jgi:hypothetical protein